MSWWIWLLVSFAVLAALYAAFVIWLVVVGRREDARALDHLHPGLHRLREVSPRDPRVSRRRRDFAISSSYTLWPVGTFPTFLEEGTDL